MNPAPRACPVCQEDLTITRLDCNSCGTSLQGQFAFSGLAQLTPEQLAFVETFVRCEGKFTRMEKEFALSYPTLRARLRAIIKALGFSTGGENQAGELTPEARARILDDLAAGAITLDEAMGLLGE